MLQTIKIPLYKQFIIGKKTYDIPTQDSFEQILAALAQSGNAKRAQAAYWIHRQAKLFIANQIKAAINPSLKPYSEPVKISYKIHLNLTTRWDITNLMQLYYKVIPDVLSGSWDKADIKELKVKVNYPKAIMIKADFPYILFPAIIQDDDWKHLPNHGEAEVELTNKGNSLTIKLEPYTIKKEVDIISNKLF